MTAAMHLLKNVNTNTTKTLSSALRLESESVGHPRGGLNTVSSRASEDARA